MKGLTVCEIRQLLPVTWWVLSMPRWLLISNYKYLHFFFSSQPCFCRVIGSDKNDPNYSAPLAPDQTKRSEFQIFLWKKGLEERKYFFTTGRWLVRWGGNVNFIWSIVSYLNKISRDSGSTFLGFYYFIWHLQILKYLLFYILQFSDRLLALCGFRKEAFCFFYWIFGFSIET